MRKIVLTIALVLAMAAIIAFPVQASAVTPKLKVPSIQIPDITDEVRENVRASISGSFWDKWFSEHPIKLPAGFKINWP